MNDLHHHIVSEHKSFVQKSPYAKVSIRKERGEYLVRVHDYFYHKRSTTRFKTLEGAQIAAELVRRHYL